MLAVTLSRNARARAVQLPAWNEALGLPRPADQQWSLRIQQVLAYESDLLEYGDLFDGSPVVEAKTAELAAGAAGRAGRGRGAGRDGARGRVRLPQGPAGRLARRPAGPDRVRRGPGGGRQLLPGHRAQPAAGRRRRRRGPAGGPGQRAGGAGRPGPVAQLPRRRGRPRRARPAAGRRGPPRRQPDGRHPGLRPGRRHHRRVVRRPARGLRRVPRPHRPRARISGTAPAGLTTWPTCGTRSAARRPRSAPAGCACCSASPAWTGTPTASSRSPSGPATPGSR